jgi:hypothetical protein
VQYTYKEGKFTPLARTIVGEWPVAKEQPMAGLEFLLFSALEFCGFEKPFDVATAGDIPQATY